MNKFSSPVLIALSVLGLTLVGCDRSGTAALTSLRPQVAEHPTDVRVVSLNLRRPVHTDGLNYWEHRKHNLAATLRHLNPDVIATQECVLSQARFIERGLPGYRWVGVGRDDGRDAGEMCAIFYDTRRFSLLDSGHFWLSEQADRPGTSFDGAWWPRMVTWVRLTDKIVGRDLFVFNTHFSVTSDDARLASARLLRRRIAELAGNEAVVVTGDFNEGEGDAAYRVLTGDTPLIDTFRAVHPRRSPVEGTRHSFSGKTRGERMDWILSSAQLVPTDASILRQSITGRPVSDHYPVTATLRWSTPTLALQPPTEPLANQ